MCISEGIEGLVKYGKACRRFILMEDGSEVRNFVANIKNFTAKNDTLVNLVLILKYLGEKGAALHGYEFDFVEQNVVVKSLEDNVYVGVESFVEHVIVINRKPLESYEEERTIEDSKQQYQSLRQVEKEKDNNEPSQVWHQVQMMVEEESSREKQEITEGSKEQEKHKKHKEKQRQIKNAIECVKVWRGMYEGSGHKISLMNAAKILGISKKSLDDYFLQLRLGELYGFDFTKNINKGIGVLRAYIKERSNKELESKVPKNIKSFELVRDFEELKAIMVPQKLGEGGVNLGNEGARNQLI